MFVTQLYIQRLYKYLHVYKKTLNGKKKKKNVYAFFNKKHLYMLDQAHTKQRIRKNSACCLKIRQFFHRANVQIGLTPPHSVRFSSLFKDPPLHNKRTFLITPQIIRVQISHIKLCLMTQLIFKYKSPQPSSTIFTGQCTEMWY